MLESLCQKLGIPSQKLGELRDDDSTLKARLHQPQHRWRRPERPHRERGEGCQLEGARHGQRLLEG